MKASIIALATISLAFSFSAATDRFPYPGLESSRFIRLLSAWQASRAPHAMGKNGWMSDFRVEESDLLATGEKEPR